MTTLLVVGIPYSQFPILFFSLPFLVASKQQQQQQPPPRSFHSCSLAPTHERTLDDDDDDGLYFAHFEDFEQDE